MLADTLGRPLRFRITPGQASDIASASDLLEGQCAKAVLADKAYDGDALRDQIAAMNATAVIPARRNRRASIPHDPDIYKHRNQIERCFSRLKHFRRFATRCDRRTIHFTGFIHLAAAMMAPLKALARIERFLDDPQLLRRAPVTATTAVADDLGHGHKPMLGG